MNTKRASKKQADVCRRFIGLLRWMLSMLRRSKQKWQTMTRWWRHYKHHPALKIDTPVVEYQAGDGNVSQCSLSFNIHMIGRYPHGGTRLSVFPSTVTVFQKREFGSRKYVLYPTRETKDEVSHRFVRHGCVYTTTMKYEIRQLPVKDVAAPILSRKFKWKLAGLGYDCSIPGDTSFGMSLKNRKGTFHA